MVLVKIMVFLSGKINHSVLAKLHSILLSNFTFSYRHHESKTATQRIEAYDLNKDEVDAIMKKLEDGHYQIACGMHFSAVHWRN